MLWTSFLLLLCLHRVRHQKSDLISDSLFCLRVAVVCVLARRGGFLEGVGLNAHSVMLIEKDEPECFACDSLTAGATLPHDLIFMLSTINKHILSIVSTLSA